MSPRLLPWTFLPQHLSLAVLTQGKKPERSASVNDKHQSRRPGYEATETLSVSLRAVFHLELWVALLLSGPCMFPAASCNALNLANKNARPP